MWVEFFLWLRFEFVEKSEESRISSNLKLERIFLVFRWIIFKLETKLTLKSSAPRVNISLRRHCDCVSVACSQLFDLLSCQVFNLPHWGHAFGTVTQDRIVSIPCAEQTVLLIFCQEKSMCFVADYFFKLVGWKCQCWLTLAHASVLLQRVFVKMST